MFRVDICSVFIACSYKIVQNMYKCLKFYRQTIYYGEVGSVFQKTASCAHQIKLVVKFLTEYKHIKLVCLIFGISLYKTKKCSILL